MIRVCRIFGIAALVAASAAPARAQPQSAAQIQAERARQLEQMLEAKGVRIEAPAMQVYKDEIESVIYQSDGAQEWDLRPTEPRQLADQEFQETVDPRGIEEAITLSKIQVANELVNEKLDRLESGGELNIEASSLQSIRRDLALETEQAARSDYSVSELARLNDQALENIQSASGAAKMTAEDYFRFKMVSLRSLAILAISSKPGGAMVKINGKAIPGTTSLEKSVRRQKTYSVTFSLNGKAKTKRCYVPVLISRVECSVKF